MSTAWRKDSTSKTPSSGKNLRRFNEAKLQAELSRCIYSEHGLEALIRPVLEQVFQSLIVVSYCIPGSPQRWVPSAIIWSRSRAL